MGWLVLEWGWRIPFLLSVVLVGVGHTNPEIGTELYLSFNTVQLIANACGHGLL